MEINMTPKSEREIEFLFTDNHVCLNELMKEICELPENSAEYKEKMRKLHRQEGFISGMCEILNAFGLKMIVRNGQWKITEK